MIDPFGLGLAIGAVVGFVFAAFIFRHPRPCPRTRDKGMKDRHIMELMELDKPTGLCHEFGAERASRPNEPTTAPQ